MLLCNVWYDLGMKKLFTLGALVVGSAFIVGVMAFGGFSTDAGEAVLVRGVVKSGGAADHVNLYITHVASAPDPSKIQGSRTDVKTSGAKLFKWIVEGGELKKVRTTANPVPEKEIVVRGTLQSDGRIIANWVVQNYREFHVEGTLQGREMDDGSIDQGWVTITVTKSVMRGMPERKFKETALLGKDLRVRINGSTMVNEIGTTADWNAVRNQTGAKLPSKVGKHLDEIDANSQKPIVLEGQLVDASNWTASQFYQRNN